MINDLKKNAEKHMHKSIETLKVALGRIRTGRAHPNLLEHVRVAYYGNDVPLNQVANVTVSDARTLTITPWEKTMVSVIEKAILTSDLGLNPATSGTVIRVPLPPLTEQRRKELTKVVKQEGENSKVAIRNIRRDINNDIKELLKEKEITEDDERRAQEMIQKLTDQFIGEIDKLLASKESELMEI